MSLQTRIGVVFVLSTTSQLTEVLQATRTVLGRGSASVLSLHSRAVSKMAHSQRSEALNAYQNQGTTQ